MDCNKVNCSTGLWHEYGGPGDFGVSAQEEAATQPSSVTSNLKPEKRGFLQTTLQEVLPFPAAQHISKVSRLAALCVVMRGTRIGLDLQSLMQGTSLLLLRIGLVTCNLGHSPLK